MKTTGERVYNLGAVYAPLRLFENIVDKYMKPYFKSGAQHETHLRKALKERRDHFIAMLCGIYYMSERGIGDKLSSGELKIASQILREAYSWGFASDYEHLMEIDAREKWGIFHKRQGVKLTKRLSAYGIFLNSRVHIFRIESGSVYDKVVRFVNVYINYLRDNSTKEVSPEYKECAENYYKYCVDMEIADRICFDRHGIHFNDALEYIRTTDDVIVGNGQYMKYRDVEREYYMCEAFNKSEYIVREAYGRLYCPFHNLPKEYRLAFRMKKTNEHVKEVVDMKGAFVKGSFLVASHMMREFGDTETADRMESIVSGMNDPYAFAVGTYNRDFIKKPVLSFLFSRPVHVRARESLLRRIRSTGFENLVTSQVFGFLDFISKNKYLFHAPNKVLNDSLKQFSCNKELLSIAGIWTGRRVFWTNDACSGNRCFRNFFNFVQRVSDAITHDCVKSAMISSFGEDVYNAFVFTSEVFDYSSKLNIEHEQGLSRGFCMSPRILPYRQADLRDGNTINNSIVCQIAEGMALMGTVLPYLKNNYSCNSFVTLHDAIYAPESIAREIETKHLARSMDTVYKHYIKYVFESNDMVQKAIKDWRYKEAKAA